GGGQLVEAELSQGAGFAGDRVVHELSVRVFTVKASANPLTVSSFIAAPCHSGGSLASQLGHSWGCLNGRVTTTSAAVLDAPTAEPETTVPTRTRERAALALLLTVTAVGYLWNITVNGMGNQFYAAAVWAGSRN